MMRLSEAIRQGSKMSAQIFGGLFGVCIVHPSKIGTCALGAAAEAVGVINHKVLCGRAVYYEAERDKSMENLTTLFPDLRIIGAECPARHDNTPAIPCAYQKAKGLTLATLIPHLNDHHCWSREAIAEWVEVQENRHYGKPEDDRGAGQGDSTSSDSQGSGCDSQAAEVGADQRVEGHPADVAPLP